MMGHLAHLCNTRLNLINVGIAGTRQQLNQVTARRSDRQVLLYQDAQSAGRGNLLTFGKICRDVLCNLSRNQRNGSYIGLFHPQILNDRQGARRANRPSHVQFCRSFEGNVNLPILHIPSDISVAVRDGQNASQGTAAIDPYRHRAVLLFNLLSHHGGRHQRAPQGRCGNRKCMVDLSGPLDHFPPLNRHRLDGRILCNHSNNIIHTMSPTFLFPSAFGP